MKAILVSLALVLFAASADAAVFRTVEVSDPSIRLGDLFADAGALADTVVADAPEPGRRLVFGARELAALAQRHGLRPNLAGITHLVVERASRPLDEHAVLAALQDALAAREPDRDRRVELIGGGAAILLPVDARPRVVVQDLELDPQGRRFSATIAVAAAGIETVRRRVAGRIVEMLQVPVPARDLRPGEPIAAADLVLQDTRARRLGATHARSFEEIVGMEPRRPLRAGQAIRLSDLREPIIVPKGSLVMALLETPRMRLTARVRALQNGAKGDVIRLVNPRSRKQIEGVVVAPGTVVLGPLAAAPPTAR